jgi:hypothetical protein
MVDLNEPTVKEKFRISTLLLLLIAPYWSI